MFVFLVILFSCYTKPTKEQKNILNKKSVVENTNLSVNLNDQIGKFQLQGFLRNLAIECGIFANY
jgi:hypothetical protein